MFNWPTSTPSRPNSPLKSKLIENDSKIQAANSNITISENDAENSVKSGGENSVKSGEKFHSTYSERASRLVGLINMLREIGAQVDLDLPTIVVAGNQRSLVMRQYYLT